MTAETQFANLLENVYFFEPRVATDLAEACDVWRRAGYVVRNYAATMDERTLSTCMIYPRAMYEHIQPHACDPDVIVQTREDATLTIVSALQLAAAKWPGVV